MTALLSSYRRTMDATPTWLQTTILSIVVPAVLFVVVHPDWYYIQNGIDTFFYTAYVENFQNVIASAGDRHYFISRWTIYMPQRLLLEVLGSPRRAYTAFRWICAAIVMATVISLGRRLWRPSHAVALGCAVLVMPMVLRPMFSDYSGTVVFPLGVCSIMLLAVHGDNAVTALVVGALGGAMMVANPFGIVVVLCAVPFWLAPLPWRRRVGLAGLVGVGALVVVLFGLFLFRLRYDVHNVYSPTFTFLREHGHFQDPLKSPRLWWLGYRLWIYLPAVVLGAAWWLRRVGHVTFASVELTLLRICALQYGFQVWYQFGRHGSTLEIEYYWAYMLPAFVLAFCVVVGAAARRGPRWCLPAIVGLLVLVLGAMATPAPKVFGSWLDALIVIAVVAATLHRRVRWRDLGVPVALVGIVFAVQFGSPRPEPIEAGELRVQSAYELAYQGDDSFGVDAYRATEWFVEYMKTFPPSVSRTPYFWAGGANGQRIAGMYLAHVSGRLLDGGWDYGVTPFPTTSVELLQAGAISTLVLTGGAAEVQTAVVAAMQLDPTLREIASAVAPDNVGTVVRILSKVPL